MFKKCPKPKTCPKYECKSTHNELLHGAERLPVSFPQNNSSGSALLITVYTPEVKTESKACVAYNCASSTYETNALMFLAQPAAVLVFHSIAPVYLTEQITKLN